MLRCDRLTFLFTCIAPISIAARSILASVIPEASGWPGGEEINSSLIAETEIEDCLIEKHSAPTDIDFTQFEVGSIAETTFHERQQLILDCFRILFDHGLRNRYR